MSTIYIHIPFCKSRCAYCDFFSTTQLEKRSILVKALLQELNLRQNYLSDKTIQSIYFGGGTPSLLKTDEIRSVLNRINELFTIAPNVEITLEANPGDLNEVELTQLHQLGINRLSIGIQSFQNHLLQLIGRRHTAEQAIEVVKIAQKVGFTNISIDLIYGLPSQTKAAWENDLQQALKLDIQHISAYGLTYETDTPLDKMRKKGALKTCSEETMNEMYDTLVNTLKISGFYRYEVSNFTKEQHYSQHNSAYWNKTHYLGVGPAAHSYNGTSRQWNIASLDKYIQGIENGKLDFEVEQLSITNCYNETIMLALRTAAGINLNDLAQNFGTKFLNYCKKQATPYLQSGHLMLCNEYIYATQDGFKILNIITESLLQA